MIEFFDAFALIAWLNTRDRHHAAVTEYIDGYRGRYVTTEWIIVEFADAMSAPEMRGPAVEMMRRLRGNRLVEVVPFQTGIREAGSELFESRPDKNWSLTDCTSFALMKERKVMRALTADHHFRQAGFIPVFQTDTQP